MSEERFVSNYLLYLLAASSEAASAQFHDKIRQRGLRVPEWRVLACLYDTPNLMVTRLARLALMEQSRMTKTIDQMVEKGLLERVTDPEDRRRVCVRLSSLGATLAEELVTEAQAHETTLLSSLADTDAARIKTVLQVLLQELEKSA